jgi:citrate synthase
VSISIERIDMSDVATPPARWLTAEEATDRLGVSRQTLYSYVSRSRIGTVAAPNDPRRTLYDAADIERLTKRKRCGRSRSAVAASTISYGEPVLNTAITHIAGDRLEYRGHSAVVLSDYATLEDVAAILWQLDNLPPTTAAGSWPAIHSTAGKVEDCIAAIARLAMLGPWTEQTDRVIPDALRILDQMAWVAAGLPDTAPLPSRQPMHARLAETWGAGPRAADMIRRVLVLMADHELNPSTYATRVAASVHAPLGACVLAGLATLVGPLHGGVTGQVGKFLADPHVVSDPAEAVAAKIASGGRVPGFGQPLYPYGDPRAAALLSQMPPQGQALRLTEAMRTMTGVAPNIDFALVVLERQLPLPQGAAFALTAVARTVGWIAHALEQWKNGGVIRPRGQYAI